MKVLSVFPESFHQVEIGKYDNYVEAILHPLQIGSILFIIGTMLAIPYIVSKYRKYKRCKSDFYSSFVGYMKYIRKNSLQPYAAFVCACYFVSLGFVLYSLGFYIYGILYI